MFPQSVELTTTLVTTRQAEIRAEFARDHMIRQARASRPAGSPHGCAVLLQPLRRRLAALDHARTANWIGMASAARRLVAPGRRRRAARLAGPPPGAPLLWAGWAPQPDLPATAERRAPLEWEAGR